MGILVDLLGAVADTLRGPAPVLEVGDDLEKGGKRDDKIDTSLPPKGPPAADLAALLSDPFALVETLGYRERYSPISYEVLHRLAYYVPIYPTIMQTRRNQVASFCAPQTDRNLPGFRVGLRDRKRIITKKEQIRCHEMEEWIVNCGSTHRLAKDDFEGMMRKLVRDGLIYDQIAVEKQRNRKGQICDFYAVDGASIRIADAAFRDGVAGDDDVCYVQVHDETVIAEFTPRQLAFGVRNPRSDLRANGYGEAELEQGIKIATALINGWNYNSKFFENGTVAKGMLNLPKMPADHLAMFRRQWQMMASGVNNAWRTPMTNLDDVKWVDLERSRRDMEWSEFINFCIKLFAGICLMDPAELNFQFGNTGQSSQMFSAPAEEKIKYSKDKGLRPLLAFFAGFLNRHIVWDLDPDLAIYFTGLDPRDSQTAVDIESKHVKYLKTINELRAENDMTPLAEGGDVILDPAWMQAKNQRDAMAQQGDDGQPGDEDDELPPDDDDQPDDQPPGDEGDEGDEDQPWSALVEKSTDAEPVRFEIDEWGTR